MFKPKKVLDFYTKRKSQINFVAFILVILFSTYIAAGNVLNGNILFHTDIGRDFYLMKEMAEKDPVILVGPAARGNDGLFHGPLWFYINFPIFVLSGGSPIVIGWYWVFLFLLTIGVCYFVARKLFNENVAMVSTAIYALNIAPLSGGMYNPSGNLLIYPLFFYFIYRYTVTKNPWFLAATFFFAGLTMQFHLGFGIYTIIVTSLYSFYLIIRNKKFLHIFAPLTVLIPLSTFILFDLKNNFIQSNFFLKILSGEGFTGAVYSGFWSILSVRFDDFMLGLLSFTVNGSLAMGLIIYSLIGYSTYIAYKKYGWADKKTQVYVVFLVLIALYFVFFVQITSRMPVYYIWGFLPLFLIFMASSIMYLEKKITYLIIACVIVSSFMLRVPKPSDGTDYVAENPGNWKFYSLNSQKVISQIPAEEFGYFVLSPELFGYSMKYAVEYNAKQMGKEYSTFKKRPYTAVFIDVEEENLKNFDMKYYLGEKIKLPPTPYKTFNFGNGSFAYIYKLTDKEVNDMGDPNIDLGTTFR